jgi:hypothetical protein
LKASVDLGKLTAVKDVYNKVKNLGPMNWLIYPPYYVESHVLTGLSGRKLTLLQSLISFTESNLRSDIVALRLLKFSTPSTQISYCTAGHFVAWYDRSILLTLPHFPACILTIEIKNHIIMPHLWNLKWL